MYKEDAYHWKRNSIIIHSKMKYTFQPFLGTLAQSNKMGLFDSPDTVQSVLNTLVDTDVMSSAWPKRPVLVFFVTISQNYMQILF